MSRKMRTRLRMMMQIESMMMTVKRGTMMMRMVMEMETMMMKDIGEACAELLM